MKVQLSVHPIWRLIYLRDRQQILTAQAQKKAPEVTGAFNQGVEN